MAHLQPTPNDSSSGPEPRHGAAFAVADVIAGEAGGVLRFTVSRTGATGESQDVSYATEAGSATAGADFRPVYGMLSFAAGSTAVRQVEVPIIDDLIAEQTETFTLRVTDPQAVLLVAATGTIIDNDATKLIVEPAELNVTEGDSATYRVALGARPLGTVTVTARAPGKLAVQPEHLSFGAATWDNEQVVTVTAERDADAVADPPFDVEHVASGGGFADDSLAALRVTIVEVDVATLAVAGVDASERDARLGFTVTLSLASAHDVTVGYATESAGQDGATAGQDYTATAGRLKFPAGSTAAQTVEVVVHDDALDEHDEQVTLTLRNAAHAVLSGGGKAVSAKAAIVDDDPPPRLSVADATLTGGFGGGTVVFAVSLEPASGRTVTVSYDTTDVTAAAGADYTKTRGTLTYRPGDTVATIEVPVSGVQVEADKQFKVALSAPEGAALDQATATGTIEAPVLPLELASLQVTSSQDGSEMYPAFDANVRHYSVRCRSTTTLQVSARSVRSDTQLTLLRADTSDNQLSTGSLDANVTVGRNHDVAIELSDGDDTVTYVVHCIPMRVPELRVLTKKSGISDGLLFVTLTSGYAIVDYNGVLRYNSEERGRGFRPHSGGPFIDGKQVRYSVMTTGSDKALRLLDSDFQEIRSVTTTHLDSHDYVMGAESFLLIGYVPELRNFRVWGRTLPTSVAVEDSVIKEVFFAGALAGSEVVRWNSWDHLKIVPDCEVLRSDGEYAHLNSLQLIGGDLIASFRGCAQVVRVDRSEGTWEMEWKLGGSDNPRNENTEFLEIAGDPLGEFCGQHQATLTDNDHLVLFDNGTDCLGPRKHRPVVTRVVEYDLSSGKRATFVREYRRPERDGYSPYLGGVTVLQNGGVGNTTWLIAWGATQSNLRDADEVAAITEVDSDGTAVFHMSISKSDSLSSTYRVYHDHEANVTIPLNLP